MSRRPPGASEPPGPDVLLALQRSIGNAAVLRLLDRGGGGSAPGRTDQNPGQGAGTDPGSPVVVQRNVGLELEHSVPIYRDLGKSTPLKNLLKGSYEYDNDRVVYGKGDVHVKVDYGGYGIALRDYLVDNYGEGRVKTPEKAVSIVEYTTAGKGLDEFAPDAKKTFEAHADLIGAEIKHNEGSLVQNKGNYYIGLPTDIKEEAVPGYGHLGLQVTHGVFPSQLDLLHRSVTMRDLNITDSARTAQRAINKILDQTATLRRTLVAIIEKATAAESEAWASGSSPGADAAALAKGVAGVAGPTVDSLFRIALTYYTGAKTHLSRGQIEKNAVPLLLRMHLKNVFDYGIQPSALWKKRIVPLIAAAIFEQADTLDAQVEAVLADDKQTFSGYSNPEVLSMQATATPSDLMIAMLSNHKDHDFSHILPGKRLSAPDPMPRHQADSGAVDAELGGVQVEHRHIAADKGTWRQKFMVVAENSFSLGIRHLDPGQQHELVRSTGWKHIDFYEEAALAEASRAQQEEKSEAAASSSRGSRGGYRKHPQKVGRKTKEKQRQAELEGRDKEESEQTGGQAGRRKAKGKQKNKDKSEKKGTKKGKKKKASEKTRDGRRK